MAVSITPESALAAIYQLAMLIKRDFALRAQAARGDSYLPTDEEMLTELQNDVARLKGRSADWYKNNPEPPKAL